MFTDECDKLKDLTHLHSFAHDFHLRLIQSYLSGETVLSNGYHLSGLLREIVSYFPNEPSFSWNYVHEGISFSYYKIPLFVVTWSRGDRETHLPPISLLYPSSYPPFPWPFSLGVWSTKPVISLPQSWHLCASHAL